MRPGNNNFFAFVLITLLTTLFAVSLTYGEVIEETGTLLGFFSGVEQGCAYDNWMSHTVEADRVNNPNNFSPPELDRETTGFGNFQVIDNLPNANTILADFYAVVNLLLQDDAIAADARLANSWMSGYYDVVRLSDNGETYLILREVLNNGYSDNNSTPEDARDDVTGSFDLGWGLFVIRPGATNPQVIVEVVHPSTDFIAPHIAIDAFNTLDAGCMFINGASRNAAYSGPTYSEDVSLSDPSRNARTAYHEAHKAAVDYLQNEWVLQLHGYNPYPVHDGVPSAQISVEREDKTNPNVPAMSWNHFDILSLTPNPPVAYDQNLWPFSEPQIDEYYTVYYPGRYNWRGKIPIPNNVDLPGTLTNCQMVYTHIGHDFVNHPENWMHIEFDEFPDVARLDGISMLDFYRYGELGPRVPTWENFTNVVHYYHPVFVAAAEYLTGPPAPVQAAVVNETASLIEFYQGNTEGTAYDNWVSHISEGVASAGYNDYGPAALDRQTTGFGYFQLVPNGTTGDNLLSGWRQVFDAFVAGNANATATALTNAGLGGIYDVVLLSDGAEDYLILREKLDNFFSDDNGTPANAADDVTGSFGYGWGLYIRNMNPARPTVVFEAPHPCDDYISTANAMDAFLTTDAGMLFVAGAGREVVWTDVAPYANSKSLSDPTRNARHPFHIAHQAAVDAIVGELVVQVHSFDTDAHIGSKSIELSAYDDPTPNPPLMDRIGYDDIISLTPQYPIAANSIGGANHAAVRVDSYYSVYYPGGSYSWNGSIPMTTTVDQWGYSANPQMLYSHLTHNDATDTENWIHFEQDEFPDVITENILSFYGSDGSVPTYQNYANSVAYYHPLYQAIKASLNTAPVWTSVPESVSGQAGSLIQFSVAGSDADSDPLTVEYLGGLPQGAQFADNGSGTGSISWQTDQQSGGDYTASFRLSDGIASVDATVPVSVTGGIATAFASAEQTISGTNQGGYTRTASSDNSYEVLTEVVSGGRPNNRYSLLEHVWTFQITGYGLTLHTEAYRNANNEGDNFILAGSSNGVNYTNLLTVTKSADDNVEQTAQIAGIVAGTYYVKVVDTDHTAGRSSLDAFYVDRLAISYTSGQAPNQAPEWVSVPGSVNAYAGDLIQFTVSGSDPDNDALGITLDPDGLPQGFSFTDNGDGTGLFRWQTAAGNEGNYTPAFTLSDGEATDVTTVTINVATPPVILVDDIALALQGSAKNLSCRGTITILTTAQQPVSGATVSAAWSGLINTNVQGVTNDAGQIVFATAALRNPTGTFRLTVNNVVKGNWTYDANQNVESSDFLNVVNGRLAGDGISVRNPVEVPQEITLLQPYPNPFNNRTMLRIGVPEDGYLEVVAYDLYGRRVSSLAGRFVEAGWHQMEWAPANLPNGEYLIHLKVGKEVRTARALLIK